MHSRWGGCVGGWCVCVHVCGVWVLGGWVGGWVHPVMLEGLKPWPFWGAAWPGHGLSAGWLPQGRKAMCRQHLFPC